MSLTEDQIKAAFLFNFTKFVEWPPESFADANSPILLGIVGNDLVARLLTEVAAGKSVSGRAVTVKQFSEGQSIRLCQIIFISSPDEKYAQQILRTLRETSVLTVGEKPGFLQAGGIINFFTDENKVKLEISLDAAARARIKISAKVIAVARLAPQNQNKGNR